jgi:hypothetical protein
MNGRVYDPTLGRFLSADPYVDGVSDAQGFNRYSYVGNNPLGATDPSGFFSLKDGLKIVAIVAVGIVTAGFAVYGAALLAGQSLTLGTAFGALVGSGATLTGFGAVVAGAAGGFGSAFTGSLLNGGSVGDAFKAGLVGGVIGGITGGLAHGIGEFFGPVGNEFGNEFGRALAHGAVGGAIEEIRGGEFRHGFYSSFAGSAAGSLAPFVRLPGYNDRTLSAVAARTTFAAVVGGTASAVGGGKFANGATTSAFQHLFNAEAHAALRKASAVATGKSTTSSPVTYSGKISYKAGGAIVSYGRFEGTVTSNTNPAQTYEITGSLYGIGFQLGYFSGTADVSFTGASPNDIKGANGGFFLGSAGIGAGPANIVSVDQTVFINQNTRETLTNAGGSVLSFATDTSPLDPGDYTNIKRPGLGISGSFQGVVVEKMILIPPKG